MAKGPSLTIKKRMMIVLTFVFAVFFVILIVRLFKLQVLDASFYAGKAARQQLSTATINANRGTIYDRNMKPLAQSATVWDVIVSPAYIRSDAQRNSIADNLSKILNIDRQTVFKKLTAHTSYEVLAKKIEKPTADLVTQYIADNNIEALGLIEDSKRYYPYGNLASQLLGFTGIDNQGLSGVEAEYDSVLKGEPGRVLTAKNAHGTDMPFDYSDYIPAKSGDNLVLTIDEVVQHYLENSLSKAIADNKVTNRATGIVMDVKTGEIIGMATVPGFDPNSPYTITDPSVKQALSALTGDSLKTATQVAMQTQWRNKAITEPYEPGSVFKVVTASAGLDAGVVKESDTFFDPGSIKVAGTTFHCWRSAGHGSQTFLEGFENSCNIVFITVGQRLGPLNFFNYFSNFGLTQKTGIDLPGEANSITIPKKTLGPVQLASSSFGQSNKITPIQLITAAAASANGGKLVQPHVVKAITDTDGKVIKTFGTTVKKQVITDATSKEIDKLMQMEVIEGTGSNAYVPGYRVGGKTGTSQKQGPNVDKDARIASFVGIAPCDDPEYAILVILDDPHGAIKYGGVIAAPVAGDILSNILPYLGVKPQYTADELKALEISTPDLGGKSAAQAKNALVSVGLTPNIRGTGQNVTGQVPAAGAPIPKGGTVIVYTNGAAVKNATVPKLMGLKPEQVNSALAAAGLNFKPVGISPDGSGTETAYEQDCPQDAQVPLGTVVTVKFRNAQIDVE